ARGGLDHSPAEIALELAPIRKQPAAAAADGRKAGSIERRIDRGRPRSAEPSARQAGTGATPRNWSAGAVVGADGPIRPSRHAVHRRKVAPLFAAAQLVPERIAAIAIDPPKREAVEVIEIVRALPCT